ncbi:hypothetical protein ACR2U3_27835, partial [Klebsiella pneumoniae]
EVLIMEKQIFLNFGSYQTVKQSYIFFNKTIFQKGIIFIQVGVLNKLCIFSKSLNNLYIF